MRRCLALDRPRIKQQPRDTWTRLHAAMHDSRLILIQPHRSERLSASIRKRRTVGDDAVTAIHNLAFQGGGVECAAYAGAVAVAEEQGVLATVRNVAGTSAGALTAAILAVGADAAALRESVVRTHFGRFLDGELGIVGELVRLLRDHGLHPGQEFCAILRRELAQLCGDAEITMGELARRADSGDGRCRHLFVVTSNVTRQRVEVLSAATQPELPVWKAVRMSIGIPLIFAPVHHEGCAYVDGGPCWDYPIDLFDGHDGRPRSRRDERPRSSETLGFALGTHREIDADRHGWRSPLERTHSLVSYLKALATLLTRAANRGHLHAGDIPRTIFIDDLGVSPADFDAAPQVIEKLIESGRAAAQAYFKTTDEHR